MNNDEAKFILGAFRPDGRDAGDATFAAALEQAERDPALRDWLQRQRAFDSAIVQTLRSVAPPLGLREAILAGSRLSVPSRPARDGRRLGLGLGLAAAAAIALFFVLSLRPSRPTSQALEAFALRDLEQAHDTHIPHPLELDAVQARLSAAPLPLPRTLRISLDELRARNCRTLKLAGRDIFEICFRRDGVWYHLYVGRRADFVADALAPGQSIRLERELAATSWADADLIYALVTQAGAEALRRML